MKSSARPWAVMGRYLRHDGRWATWRFVGSYGSEISALAGASRGIAKWEAVGVLMETRIIAPGESRKVT